VNAGVILGAVNEIERCGIFLVSTEGLVGFMGVQEFCNAYMNRRGGILAICKSGRKSERGPVVMVWKVSWKEGEALTKSCRRALRVSLSAQGRKLGELVNDVG
jgi:hypothetical protein